jgi:hypothetical protein
MFFEILRNIRFARHFSFIHYLLINILNSLFKKEKQVIISHLSKILIDYEYLNIK